MNKNEDPLVVYRAGAYASSPLAVLVAMYVSLKLHRQGLREVDNIERVTPGHQFSTQRWFTAQ